VHRKPASDDLIGELKRREADRDEEMAKMKEEKDNEIAKMKEEKENELAKMKEEKENEIAKMKEEKENEIAEMKEALETAETSLELSKGILCRCACFATSLVRYFDCLQDFVSLSGETKRYRDKATESSKNEEKLVADKTSLQKKILEAEELTGEPSFWVCSLFLVFGF